MKRKKEAEKNGDEQGKQPPLKRRKFWESSESIRVAVVGCAHGELDIIYKEIEKREKKENITIDILLICGDFQACRHMEDLETMNCPVKYRHMRDFHKYYNQVKTAPKLTIFVGGNHEAVAHNLELYYGGYVCPNMYYLGYSGCVIYRGLRICGYSGIFKQYDYNKGYYERLPLQFNETKSMYHTREFEVMKLDLFSKQLEESKGRVDIMLSHDWPRGVWKGEKDLFKRFRKHLARDMKRNELGSLGGQYVLKMLKPKFWFSGHLHTNYRTDFQHEKSVEKTTFVSSSKPNPGQNWEFLQVVEIPLPDDEKIYPKENLYYDKEWLKICKASHAFFPTKVYRDRIEKQELEQSVKVAGRFVEKEVFGDGLLGKRILEELWVKVPNSYDSVNLDGKYVPSSAQPMTLKNLQRESFLKLLGLEKDYIGTMVNPDKKVFDKRKGKGRTWEKKPTRGRNEYKDIKMEKEKPKPKPVPVVVPVVVVPKKKAKKKKKKPAPGFFFDWEDDADENPYM